MFEHPNRSAVIITPRQAFHDLVARLCGEPAEQETSQYAEDEATVYLVDEATLDMPTMEERLAHCFQGIFFAELEGWYTDTSNWPADVTWQEFEAFFHISFQSMVFDATDSDLEYD